MGCVMYGSPLLRSWPRCASSANLLEHLDTDLALSDFAQCGHGRLVLAVDLGRVALAQHARTVRGGKHQLETVRDLFEAVFDGDAGHGVLSGNVQCGKSVGTGTALGGIPEPLRVDNGFQVEKRALK